MSGNAQVFGQKVASWVPAAVYLRCKLIVQSESDKLWISKIHDWFEYFEFYWLNQDWIQNTQSWIFETQNLSGSDWSINLQCKLTVAGTQLATFWPKTCVLPLIRNADRLFCWQLWLIFEVYIYIITKLKVDFFEFFAQRFFK